MGTQRHVQLNQALEKIVNTLVAKYQPEKIILFGSLAAGHVGEWSDIDLAILKETTKPFIERSVEVAVLCLAPVGVDYLVYTPAEFAQMIQEGNPFIVNEIVNKGKILYSHTISVCNSRWLTYRPSKSTSGRGCAGLGADDFRIRPRSTWLKPQRQLHTNLRAAVWLRFKLATST